MILVISYLNSIALFSIIQDHKMYTLSTSSVAIYCVFQETCDVTQYCQCVHSIVSCYKNISHIELKTTISCAHTNMVSLGISFFEKEWIYFFLQKIGTYDALSPPVLACHDYRLKIFLTELTHDWKF